MEKYYRLKITAGLTPELAAARLMVAELRNAAMKITAQKHGGDASRKWRKKKCIRGHDLYGPSSRVRRTNGKGDCILCANYLRREARKKYLRDNNLPERKPKHFAFGKEKTISEWAKEFNVVAATIIGRMRRGLSLEDALKIPKGSRTRKGFCMNGHAMIGRNLFAYSGGKAGIQTKCRICFYRRKRQYRKAKKDEILHRTNKR